MSSTAPPSNPNALAPKFTPELAPLFFAIMSGLCLYGMTIVQGTKYWNNYRSDHIYMRRFVLALLVMHTGIAADLIGMGFDHLCNYWGDATHPLTINHYQSAFAALEPVATLMVHSFFAWRVDLLTGHRWACVLVIIVATISFLGGFASFIGSIIIKSFADAAKLRALVGLWYSATLVTDLIITLVLVGHFRHAKTGFTRADNFVTQSISLAFQTGLIPAIFAVNTLIFFLGQFQEAGLTYLAFLYSSPGAYVVSFFSVVNSRPTDAQRAFLQQSYGRDDSRRAEPYSTKMSFGPGQYATQMLQPQATVFVAKESERLEDMPAPEYVTRTDNATSSSPSSAAFDHNDADYTNKSQWF